MPIYVVTQKAPGADVRLIDAAKPASVAAFIVTDMFEIRRAEEVELFRLGAQGVELEYADAPAPQKEVGPNPDESSESTEQNVEPDPPKTDDFGPVDPIDPNAERMANEG